MPIHAERKAQPHESITEGDINAVTGAIIGAAMRVHSALGPGLFEGAYESCLAHDLGKLQLPVRRQVVYPVIYDGVRIGRGFRVDLIVADCVIVEIKAVSSLLPIHEAQLVSYLKLSSLRAGLLLNFHAPHLKDGIRRIVNRL